MIEDVKVLVEQLTAELEQVRRERDAAVRDVSVHDPCAVCKHCDCGINDSPCRECLDGKKPWEEWQWRGVCAENGGAEDGNSGNSDIQL